MTKTKPSPARTSLAKTIESFRHSRHVRDVFRDFTELAAYAVANKFDLWQAEQREAAYMRLIGTYDAEEARTFAHMLGELQLLFADGIRDHLGALAGELELLNKRLGQFFTPFELSYAMATVTLLDAQDIIDRQGFITVCDPFGGAGGMGLAAAKVLRDQGIDHTKHLHVTAIEIDNHCVHMSFLQFAAADIPAVVLHGNAVTQEIWGRWYTPSHILDGWTQRLGPNAARERTAMATAQEYWAALPMADRLERTLQAGLPADQALQAHAPPELHGSLAPDPPSETRPRGSSGNRAGT